MRTRRIYGSVSLLQERLLLQILYLVGEAAESLKVFVTDLLRSPACLKEAISGFCGNPLRQKIVQVMQTTASMLRRLGVSVRRAFLLFSLVV
jgi:hypothetical protein